MPDVLIRIEPVKTQREGHVLVKAKTAVKQLQAKECQRLVGTLKPKRKPWNRFCPRTFERAWSYYTLVLDLTVTSLIYFI